MLKANLEKRNSLGDDYLAQLIQAAKTEITREGIVLSDDAYSFDEANVIVMYAAWLWRRRDTMESMPPALRVALNDRKFREAVAND